MESQIFQRDLPDFLSKSYVNYAMEVIIDRALIDMRDGLKPSYRAGLYSMHELNLHSKGAFKKGAAPVGHALGLYYPHSDTGIYDALVGLSQEFYMRYPLIQAHGNHGNLDGDPHAAMRYLELKLSPIGETMMQNLNPQICQYQDNFDNSKQWPKYFASLIPNAIINGQKGIAVGMASYTIPHNLTEVLNTTCTMLDGYIEASKKDFDCIKDDPLNLTGAELLKTLKGPDFPLGGTVVGKKGIIDYYETGKGKVIHRCGYTVSEKKGEQVITITEFPYKLKKISLFENLKEQANDKLKEIKNVEDISNHSTYGIEITLKKGTNVDRFINKLIKLKLGFEIAVNVNNTLLVRNVPKKLSTIQMLREYILHCIDVVTKQLYEEQAKNEKRIFSLGVLIWGIENSEAVVPIIRENDSSDDIFDALLEVDNTITEEKAAIIGDIRLKQLSRGNLTKYTKEKEALEERNVLISTLIEEPCKLYAHIQSILKEINQRFGDKRRTVISRSESNVSEDADFIDTENIVIVYSTDGLIKAVKADEIRQTKRGAKGVKSTLADDASIKFMVQLENKDHLFFFTNLGKCHILKGYDIPLTSRQSRGRALVNYLQLEENEKVVSIVNNKSILNHYFIFVTRKGIIKKLNGDNLRFRGNNTRVISFKENDALVSAQLVSQDVEHYIIATKQGLGIRFKLDEIKATGKNASGMIGIRFKKESDCVIAALPEIEGCNLLTITSKGYSKQFNPSEIKITSKGTKGSYCQKATVKTGNLVDIVPVTEEMTLVIGTKQGKFLKVENSEVRALRKSASGVKIANLEETDCIVAISTMIEETIDESDD